MRIGIAALAVFLFCLENAALAEDVTTDGILSDRDFYRLISCGASPGMPCQKAHKRWDADKAKSLTVGLRQVQAGYPPLLDELVLIGLLEAIEAINRVTSNVQLSWVLDGSEPDIDIYLVIPQEGWTIAGTGTRMLDGAKIANAIVVSNRRHGQITEAAIAFSHRLDVSDVNSIALEDLFQALGFIYDIDNPAYLTRSIVYEKDSFLERLGEQDIRALKTKYAY